ncbi:MAG: hypothetical protein PHP53_23925 [Prolixibacteraceae bacterium]|nr:hypothetical protein [Prolixibacteraceae bacterium]
MAVNQKANADSLWAGLQSIGRGVKATIEAPSNLFRSALDGATNLVTTGKTGTVLDKPLFDTSAGKYADKPLYESIVPSRPVEAQPLDMSGFQSTVTGAGNLSNGLWNNGVGAQNPLSVGFTPTQVDTVAKAPIGAGNTLTQSSTPSPMLYASNQASNFNGAPTIGNATMSNPTQEMTNPMDMSMPVEMPSGYNVSDPTSGLAANAVGSASTPYSFMDNFTDFSSKDAAKNSLGNISTGVGVAGGLFDAYTKYQTQKAQADYQNRIAGLYEKQYNDTEARRANAQANYDASVPK